MVQGLSFHLLNVDRTLNQTTLHWEKLYLIYVGFWLGPQKKNPNFRNNLNQETSSHYSVVLML
jgi:hypothetical protein